MSKTKRIAINGFGRIGRAIFRIYSARKAKGESLPFEVVRINDRVSSEVLKHLLYHDTVYGGCDESTRQLFDEVTLTQVGDLGTLDWQGVDFLIECTGAHRTLAALEQHLSCGAERVLLSAPAFDELDKMLVFGVNHDQLQLTDRLVSNASCSTNAAATTLAALLNFDACDIEQVWLTEIHGFTTGQNLLDQPHADPRRARSAVNNIIPTRTLGLDILDRVLPSMAGRVQGSSIRVPVTNGACLDITLQLTQSVSEIEINQYFQSIQSELLGYTDEPLVSSDFSGRSESAIFDATQTRVLGNSLKIVVWFDNEWGYSNRMLDLLDHWISNGLLSSEHNS